MATAPPACGAATLADATINAMAQAQILAAIWNGALIGFLCRTMHGRNGVSTAKIEPDFSSHTLGRVAIRDSMKSRCLAFLASLCLAVSVSQAADAARPNILWLIAEDFGNHLSC